MSIAAQVLLLVSLLQAGRRDWWVAYLAFDLVRSAALWPQDPRSLGYFYTCAISEPFSAAFQILAVSAVTSTASRPWGICLGIGGVLWAMTLTSDDWPIGRRALLLARQGEVFWCAGSLIAAASDGKWNNWMLAYYVLHISRVIAEQISVTAPAVALVNTASLFAVTALFVGWGTLQYFPKRGCN